MHRVRVLPWMALVILPFLASGCGKQLENPFRSRGSGLPVRIRVDNNNFLQVAVYVEGVGSSIRLGEVGGKTEGVFELSASYLTVARGIRLRVEPVGSPARYVSPEVFVSGGEEVQLFVAAALQMSHISVR